MSTPSLQTPIREGVPLAGHSTLGIGGPARYLVEVTTLDEARAALAFAREKGIPFFVVGKGSNCLFDDRGFSGLIIVNKIQHSDGFRVGAGYSFSLLGAQMARKGFSGLEFASGIPGTVGGAVYMNAGASGAETKDVVKSVLFLDVEGKEHLITDFAWDYRTSPFQTMQGIIIEATFALTPDPEARARQIAIVRGRMATQPYSDKSAGCIFRNPPGAKAGALIDACKLKGKEVGGAAVSTLHANFLINKEGATSADFLRLVDEVQKTVLTETGYDLKMEVERVPYVPR